MSGGLGVDGGHRGDDGREAALHVGRAAPDERVAVASRFERIARPSLARGDDVAVAEEEHAALRPPVAAESGDEVGAPRRDVVERHLGADRAQRERELCGRGLLRPAGVLARGADEVGREHGDRLGVDPVEHARLERPVGRAAERHSVRPASIVMSSRATSVSVSTPSAVTCTDSDTSKP